MRGLSIFLGIVITADVIRLNNDDFERIYEKVLGFLMRESEKVSRSDGRALTAIASLLTTFSPSRYARRIK